MQNFSSSSSSFIHELSGHHWPLQTPALHSYPQRRFTWQQTLKYSGARSHQPYTCVTRRIRRRVDHILIWHLLPLSRYLPHYTSSKVNKHSGEKLVKTVLHQVCRILSFWHQQHLALVSSVLLVLTSNGLLRALQGDYLCTITESLWSLCDNGILS